MKFSILALWALLWQWAGALAVPSLLAPTVDGKSAERLLELQTQARENLEKTLKSRGHGGEPRCTLDKLKIRKEW